MANRILLGERSGQYGLWVSKPGFNVLTAGQDGLLLSMGEDSLQAVYSASVGIANTGAEVARHSITAVYATHPAQSGA